jgi:hypothetical protein
LVELIEKDFDLGEELKKLNIHLNEMKLWTFKMLRDFFSFNFFKTFYWIIFKS